MLFLAPKRPLFEVDGYYVRPYPQLSREWGRSMSTLDHSRKFVVLSAGAAIVMSATSVVMTKEPSNSYLGSAQNHSIAVQSVDAPTVPADRRDWIHLAARD
jgi:hypothetical protein